MKIYKLSSILPLILYNSMEETLFDGQFFARVIKKNRMRKKFTVKGLWKVLKESFTGFSEDKVLKLSGAVAYYTIFSMAPLLIVIIFV